MIKPVPLPSAAPKPGAEIAQDLVPIRAPAIDAGWRQWIAEQLLRRCTPESMALTMQGAGLVVDGDAAALQHLIDALDPVPQGFDIVTP